MIHGQSVQYCATRTYIHGSFLQKGITVAELDCTSNAMKPKNHCQKICYKLFESVKNSKFSSLKK